MTVIESDRALLVDPSDRMLLMKLESGLISLAPTESRKTFWPIPGGSLNPGDAFEDALVREISEKAAAYSGLASRPDRHRAVGCWSITCC